MRVLRNAVMRAVAGITAAGIVITSAVAEDYVIGSSAGLTGYTAILDGAWVDGVKLAIKQSTTKADCSAIRSSSWSRTIAPSRKRPSLPTARCCLPTARRSS